MPGSALLQEGVSGAQDSEAGAAWPFPGCGDQKQNRFGHKAPVGWVCIAAPEGPAGSLQGVGPGCGRSGKVGAEREMKVGNREGGGRTS